MSKDLTKELPRIGWVISLIFTVISFIWCYDWKEILQQAILPCVDWWPLRALVKTAIVMAYVIPLFIGGLLTQTKYAFLQVVGMSFVGIAAGIIIRICLVFVGVLNPYSF